MGKKCSILTCRSRKENIKVSFHNSPGTISGDEAWSRALGIKNVDNRWNICDLHFAPEDIISERRVTDSVGNEFSVPLLKKRLRKGALPLNYVSSKEPPPKVTKFNENQSDVHKKSIKILHESSVNINIKSLSASKGKCISKDNVRISDENNINVLNIPSQAASQFAPSNILSQSSASAYTSLTTVEKENLISKDYLQEFADENNTQCEDASQVIGQEVTNNINTDVREESVPKTPDAEVIEAPSVTTAEKVTQMDGEESTPLPSNDIDKSSTNESNEGNLYNHILNAIGNLQLPYRWCLSLPLHTKAIMFSVLEAMSSPSGSNNAVPIFERQVFVHEDGRIQIRLYDKNVDVHDSENNLLHLQTEPKTVEEFLDFINVIDESPICPGGPSLSVYKNVHPENAYRDRTVWRHNKCSRILPKSGVCKSCFGLYKILPQCESRQRRRKCLKFRLLLPAAMKPKVKNMRKKMKVRAQRLSRIEKKMQALLIELDEVHQRLQSLQENTFETQLKEHSKNIPDKQILLIKECFAAGKKSNAKGRRYSDEWLLLCLLLYIRSSAAYNMLRQNNILPLPCKTTITKYLRASNVGFGFDDNFFNLFAERLDVLSQSNEFTRHGIISFDEISVRTSVEVNSKTMTFEGLQDHGEEESEKSTNLDQQADHALVIMFSSLTANFHQPIATFASKGPTSSNVLSALVLLAIINTEKAGGLVEGIVCDGATTNRSMWKELGISGKLKDCRFRFENPFDETRFVYAFSDAPHLIKCIRNRLEEKKVLKIDGNEVRWDYYKFLYERDCRSDLRVCPKLTDRHVNPVKSMKMRVSLATQIFSRSVAKGMQLYLLDEQRKNPEKKVFEGCEPTINFSLRIDEMFDALNRSHPREGIRENSKDLQVLQESIDWLDKWEREKESKDLFLTETTAEGLRVTLYSTIHLTNHLLKDCGFAYVLTSKMNQDCLEQFFGCIRQAGCQNDHPTLSTFKQLYHLLSIYQILKPPKSGNCSVREDTTEQKKITLKDLRRIFPDIKKSYKHEHLKKLKESLENLVEYDEWVCDDLLDSDVSLGETEDCVIYYISGFAARKLRKVTKCEACVKAFASAYENLIVGLSEAELVNLKTKGGLAHPNIHLFELFKKLEERFQIHKDSATVYHLVIDDLLASKYHFTFPCEEHKTDMTSQCIHYYLNMRMRQYCKLKNRDATKTSQDIKKKSKFYST